MKVVKFDLSTRGVVGDIAIPFDEEFYLEVDGIAYERINRASLFEVKYRGGKSDLQKNWKVDTTHLAVPNSRLEVSSDSSNKKKVKLKLPPLKPSRDFDIFLEMKLSPENQKLAFALNREIFKVLKRTGSTDSVLNNKLIKKQFTMLSDEANDKLVGHSSVRAVFFDTLVVYCQNVYTRISSPLNKIYYSSGYEGLYSITANALQLVSSNSVKSANKVDLTVFNNMITTVHNDVFFGYLPINFNELSKRADTLNPVARIANIDTTLKYFYKLRKLVDDLAILNKINFQPISDSLHSNIKDLVDNKEKLSGDLKAMNEVLDAQIEAKWLVGTSGAKDLQAEGKNYFSVLAGFAYGFAKTNYDKVVGIPKLYLGLNVNFRALNKDLRPYQDIARKAKSDTTRLLSRRNIWNFVGLNVGLTLGSMTNGQFDNFYANTSLIVGPSVRITRLFRVSAGPMFLTRVQMSPILAQKKPTAGVYASLALDIDFLEPVTKIINMVFK
ncbi:hypothetical protein L0662_13100 [Dyadobacter sp. CY22]|nr:hypothetical protein [Dyadobacter chenhuakuii]MCF2494298.1 hypothetical protein [Dyadobacter chenhuakuii]